MEDIQTLAQRKQTYVPVRCENDAEIHALLEEYDVIVEDEIEEMKLKIQAIEEAEKNGLFPGLSAGIPCPAFKYYTENGAEEGSRDYVLVGCIHKLKGDGYTKDKIFRELIEFGDKCNPPLQESYIKTRLDAHFKKSYSLCTFFSKVSEICTVCSNRRF